MAATCPTLAALLAEKAQREPDLPILIFVDVGADGSLHDETRTFRQLHDNAACLARGLQTLGVRPGQTFAIMMNNHPEFVEAMIAAAMLGAVFVPIDARTIGDKLEYMLGLPECRGIVCSAACIGAIRSVHVPTLDWMVVIDGSDPAPDASAIRCRSYGEILADPGGPLTPHAVDPASPMFMMFTSGTTGNPKAVTQSHGTYMVAAPGLRFLGIRPGDVLYTGLSLAHINAQGTMRAGLALSIPVVISRKFTRSRLWDICRAYGCTVFNLLGGMIPEIFSVPPRSDDRDNPVRLIISAGMPASLWNAYRERFGVEICEIYGATEGGGAMFNLPGVGPIGSMGKPGPGVEAMPFDDHDQPCAAHEPGELRFRRVNGLAFELEYHRNRAASDEKVRGGWFRTGDVVHYDDEGWFFFHHRIGGGVRRNGDFVNTALVEAVISRSGLVEDVYVYGVPTARNVGGEKTLVATVVPVDPERFTTAQLLEHCRHHLERNDIPEIVHVVTAIPKTVSEKPIERACIELLRNDGIIGA